MADAALDSWQDRPVDESAEIVRLLDAWREGDQAAYDALIPHVYQDLRRLARGKLRRDGGAHSVQATQLVHEAYLRLANADVAWRNRTHFLCVAAQVMGRVLVDHARTRQARKRDGGLRVTFDGEMAAEASDPVDMIVLHDALERLRTFDPRQATVVELSYFGGLTYEEIANLLAISEATVDRDLRHAKAWLRTALVRVRAQP